MARLWRGIALRHFSMWDGFFVVCFLLFNVTFHVTYRIQLIAMDSLKSDLTFQLE